MSVPKSGRLRVLWSFARPHRARLALGLVLALAGSGVGLATPLATKWVLDSLGADGGLRGPIVLMAVLLVVGAVMWTWQSIVLGTLGERVVLAARQGMVDRFFRATVPAISSRAPGELVTRVTSDTLLLRDAAASSVIGLINGVVMLVGTLVLMAALDLVLFLTTVASVIAIAILFGLLMPAIAVAKEKAQAHVGALGGTLEGALRAVRTVKASRAEERQSAAIITDARGAAEQGIRAIRREAIAWAISWSGIQLAIILILGIGAWRVSDGDMAVSTLIAFLLYSFGLMGPVTTLSQNVTALQNGIAAAGRIREVDDLPVETSGVSTNAAARITGPVLELRGITAAYGPDSPPAVRGIDLDVPRVGHAAIVGPSGAGKTTLFSLILRFLEPQEGSLLVNGVPYRDLTHADIRAHLAYVEQETPVVPGTIRDNLLFSHPDATDDQLQSALAAVRLDTLADTLPEGLDTPLSGTSVSGGQRQRIALARAVLTNPDVLLLDEATAQVDGLTEAALHDVIRAHASRAAVVTIAHRLSTVVDADTIIVMAEGRIRARGTHAELLATDSLYRDLVESLRIPDSVAKVGSMGH
ncbi:ABC transporter ATP-binding protein [Actinokineospora cianjurensis]|uniref:ABC-type multidrug transport system fused ATPase/permease subunit n=1 Tax=Actinokineospora cianjurensis TaxID=585224 RepID=A0A421B2H4_9PSEU|nr:ABC transporter ATP-binding protein [Actinokineospora cianjurensis]RLK58554.1 ABC-type multidrug transport system fused ATPase/permease subunit [Actinokineospora cianjurensis]